MKLFVLVLIAILIAAFGVGYFSYNQKMDLDADLDAEKVKYLIQLEHFEDTITRLESKLLSNKIDTISALQLATNTVELRIKNNLVLDTVNMSLAKKLNDYKVMRRSLGPLGAQFHRGKEAIREERETLKKLRNDIENSAGEPAKYKDYLNFEKGKLEKISILIADYITQKTKTMNTFNSLHAELNKFSLSLLSKKE